MTAQEVGKRMAILRGGLLKTAGWPEFAPQPRYFSEISSGLRTF